MHTSIGLALLSALSAANVAAGSLTWQKEYGAAVAESRRTQKPLALFVGSGPQGQHAVLEEGSLSPATRKVLSEKYVCFYLDRSQPSAQKLIAQLDMQSGRGIVISDRGASVQAFYHDGKLAEEDLRKRLQQFAESTVVVTTTVTHVQPVVRTSFYAPAVSATVAPAVSVSRPAVCTT